MPRRAVAPRIASLRLPAVAAAALLLAACASTPIQPEIAAEPPPPPRDLIAELYAMVEADDAIVVEPLPDPEVEDLRLDATDALALRDLERAARSVMQALEIRPGRPDLLQMRAEVALGLQALEEAESFALESFESGPKLGPLCRRNWAAVQLSRELRGEVESAASAREQADLCTREPVLRM
ncbi:MAG: hypothetical protein MEQ07_11045 [Aquimonas sp.]|nr:hypothetical protein [Aquimonas sp.]